MGSAYPYLGQGLYDFLCLQRWYSLWIIFRWILGRQFRDFLTNGNNGSNVRNNRNLGNIRGVCRVIVGRNGWNSRRFFYCINPLFWFIGSFVHPSVGKKKSRLQYQGMNKMLKMTFVTVKSNSRHSFLVRLKEYPSSHQPCSFFFHYYFSFFWDNLKSSFFH